VGLSCVIGGMEGFVYMCDGWVMEWQRDECV
jgi:hypothetical protein